MVPPCWFRAAASLYLAGWMRGWTAQSKRSNVWVCQQAHTTFGWNFRRAQGLTMADMNCRDHKGDVLQYLLCRHIVYCMYTQFQWQNSSLFTAFRAPNNIPAVLGCWVGCQLWCIRLLHFTSCKIWLSYEASWGHIWSLYPPYPPVLSLRMSKSSIRRISVRSWRISTCENWKGSGTKCEATTRSMTAILARQTRSNTMQKQTRWRRKWSFESRIWERNWFC